VREPSYFFRLSKYQDALVEHFRAHPEFVAPRSRYNEVLSFIKSGLRDLSISRSRVQWGVPVPDHDGHTVYVWLDALTNYISALGALTDDTARYERFWPADVHVIGKDILRFHAVYWPAFLLSAGLPLPRQVFAHGWWTVEGEKMSKTAGNVVDPFAVVERFGRDAFRYFVLREVPFGLDGDYSEKAMIHRVNSDLANDLGNLVHRTTSMIRRYTDGRVPAAPADAAVGADLRARAAKLAGRVDAAMQALQFSRALEAVWEFVRAANRFVEEQRPWDLKKEGKTAALDATLYALAESVRLIALHLAPFVPDACARIDERLGGAGADRPFAERAAWGTLAAGTPVTVGDPLFPRVE
jgi:methionyl-tRNA synthetase